ncbi:glycosyltransferase [Demequina sp.]|uniref:glycosyltransferase n=1 Tax=Demequina sp. TaxID=2050685 RepID=UPI003A8ABBB5
MNALRAGAVIASVGRPGLLADVMTDLDAQDHPFARKVISVPDHASLPPDLKDWTSVVGTRGAAAQRNAGIEAIAGEVDVLFFFDDDAVVRSDYISQSLAVFERHPCAVALTGRVLLDGAAHSAGEVSRERALAALAHSTTEPLTGATVRGRTLYGCNFAFRHDRVPDIRFDDRLPLYSWLEDHDLARRLMHHGHLLSAHDCVVVHRGASSGGRTNHVRLGYSQLMNPVHLARTGSFPLWLAAWEIFRPTVKNLAYAVVGDQASWRRQRVRGNALGVGDALRGRITPERILDL